MALALIFGQVEEEVQRGATLVAQVEATATALLALAVIPVVAGRRRLEERLEVGLLQMEHFRVQVHLIRVVAGLIMVQISAALAVVAATTAVAEVEKMRLAVADRAL
jgi:hypothetical protein